jgi:hypothetical protein
MVSEYGERWRAGLLVRRIARLLSNLTGLVGYAALTLLVDEELEVPLL